MNESQKHSKVEMEILRYEKELMRKARLKKLKKEPLSERIAFIKNELDKKHWTADEIYAELKNNGLAENIELKQVEEELKKDIN